MSALSVEAHTEKFEVRNRWTNAVQFTAEIICSPDASIRVKLGLAIRWAVKSGADLSGADLSGADLSGADLSGAYLSGAYLSGADLSRAYLSGAYLSGADLSGAYLSGADLSRAYLSGAYLSGADLSGADLSRAYLSGAYLSRAYLSGADLSRAYLSGAYLSRAYLSGAYLSGAYLSGADLPEEALRPFKADLFLTLSTLAAGPLEAQHLVAKLRAGQVDGSTYGNSGTECACLVGTIAQPRGVSGEALDHNSDRPAERWFMMITPGDAAGAQVDGKETDGGYAARKALEWTLDWCKAHGIDPDAPAAAQVEAA
ncbi:pentapeptide repeat-containing protein [Sphingomonas yabuuchiae]|uniref:pentapeptide repeat-containing protein n=1 Tax=Sphingomonas yabuuchiae TaxID=172044 RepID=UPI0035EF822F